MMLAACGSHSLALNTKGRVYSWGCGLYGRCGHGNEEDVVSPKEIISFRTTTTTNSSASFQRSMMDVVSSSSSSSSSYSSSAGSNSSSPSLIIRTGSSTPVNDSIMDKIVYIAVGGFHSIVVTNNGNVYGFGGGEHGQIGTGNAVNALTPVRIPSLPPVAQVACGWSHTLFLCTDSSVYATGNADHYKIPLASKVPVCMNTLKGLPVTSIATYNEHCIILTAPCGTNNTFAIPNGIVPQTPNTLISNQQLLYSTPSRQGSSGITTMLSNVSSSSSPMMSPLPPPLLRSNAFQFSSTDSHTGVGSPILAFLPPNSSSRGEASASTLSIRGSNSGSFDNINTNPFKSNLLASPLSTPKLSGIKRSLSLQSSISSSVSSLLSPRSTRLALSSIHHGIHGPTANYVSDIHGLINNPYSFTDVTLRVRKNDPLMIHPNDDIPSQSSFRSLSKLTGNYSGVLSSSSSSSSSSVSETDDLTALSAGDEDYEILHAHRAILAARSPTFASMFTTGMKEMQGNCVSLEDISVPIALYFLHFIYTDTLPLDMETYELIELWCIADRFLVDRLYRLCMERLQRELTVSNAPYLLHIAVQLHAEPVKDQIIFFMSEPLHFDQVTKQEAFAELDKNLILEVLARRKA